jgi:hypothetical protein
MIDPEERKANSVKILQQLNVPVFENLPSIESAADIRLRKPSDVARRLICLMRVSDVARDADPEDCINYLRKNSLFENLSPKERDHIDNRDVTEQVRTNLSWRCEAALVLLWTLGKFPELPIPQSETDLDDIYVHMPPFDDDPRAFIETAKLIDKEKILNQLDLIYRMHWATRSAQSEGNACPGLNWGVVQEWHQAINWLTYYVDEEWDDVPTDT